MREGWEYKKLGEVALPKSKIDRASKIFAQDDEIRYIDISSIDNCSFKIKDVTKYSMRNAPSRAQQRVLHKDIVVSTVRPNLKNIAIIDRNEDNMVASSGFCVLRFADDIERNYFFHYITSDVFTAYLVKHTSGANYPAVKDSVVRDAIVPIPPKSVQLEIVSELDQINELIRLKKEQLKDYDNLAQSIFYEMFGDPVENEKEWEVKKLGDIAAFKNGLNFGKAEQGIAYKFLGVSDFQDNTTVCSDNLGAIELSQPLSEEYFLEEGDIVFVRSNGSKELVGRNVLMHISEPTTYSGFCIRCRLMVERWNAVFLSFLLKTSSMRPLITNSGRGCNISNLNQKILGALPIIDVPFESQQEFSSRISQVERQKAEVSNAIADLETLLASRMQYWFE